MPVMYSVPEVQTHSCQFKYYCVVRHSISNGPKCISFVFGYSCKIKKNKCTQLFMKLICLTKGFKDGKQFDILSFAWVSQHLSLYYLPANSDFEPIVYFNDARKTKYR